MGDKKLCPMCCQEIKDEDELENKEISGTVENFNFPKEMSLRDYFAAKAMQGIISSSRTNTIDIRIIVKNSYQVADVMIKERDNH